LQLYMTNQISWIELNMKTVPQLQEEEKANRIVVCLIQTYS